MPLGTEVNVPDALRSVHLGSIGPQNRQQFGLVVSQPVDKVGCDGRPWVVSKPIAVGLQPDTSPRQVRQ